MRKKVSAMLFNKAIKYQIFPNEEQKALMAQTFGCARKVYNLGKELQDGLYSVSMKSMSKQDLNSFCNHVWKDDYPYLRDVDKFALTNSVYALMRGYNNFFEKRGKKPKFKSRKSKQSYTTNATNGNIAITFGKKNRGQVKLPKLGWIDTCTYRKPGDGWVIKQATVSHTPSGKYYVSILFSYSMDVEDVTPTYAGTIGLDYSSPKFYVDSEGNTPDVPHALRKAEQRLAKAQQRLSRMTKGSNNYEKQRIVVAKLHEQVANKRKDFCHKESRKIANSYDTVCMEDLDLRALAQTLNFGKATADNGFGMFRTFLSYKLKEQGKHFVKVDKWYPSSKTCHHCGAKNASLQLGQMEWVCPSCGALIDRDVNAAHNIKDEGWRLLTAQLAA